MSHAWRPLFVVLFLLVIFLIVRKILVPADFMAAGGDYKYRWHRVSNEEEWKNFPVKYQGREFCEECHSDKAAMVKDSGHTNVQCENCHVMVDPDENSHPVDLKENFDYIPAVGIDSSRALCQRCHIKMVCRPRPEVYIANREVSEKLKLIVPSDHNPEIECITCHDVHMTGFK